MNNNTDEDFAMRHKRRMKRIRQKRMIRRISSLIVLSVIGITVCMYKLPIFNIQKVIINGNEKLTYEEINEKTGISIGENIFKTDMKNIELNVSLIPYIDEVSVKRAFIPSSVIINVRECEMAASIKLEGFYAGIDKNAKVLEIMNEAPAELVKFDGLKVNDYTVGRPLAIDDDNGIKDIMIVLNAMNGFEYRDKISPVSLADMSNISFNYDNRLDILCGSIIDFERKIDMLEEVIRSDDIKENARGTVNLVTSKKIIYRP